MKRLLVTGADGFVGKWLVRAARAADWSVIAGIAPGGPSPQRWLTLAEGSGVRTVEGDLRDAETIQRMAAERPDAVIHLAAVASGPAARRDPTAAWAINAGVTGLLAEAFAQLPTQPTFLLVSTGEVYGSEYSTPITEAAPLAPISPYAATKVGAEFAALECWRRTGLPVVIARPFPHTGPGQSDIYVFPALVKRLKDAAATRQSSIPVGNLDPIRDLLDVRDVVTAYLALIEKGVPGEAYNIASGTGVRLGDALEQLAKLIGSNARAVPDPALVRAADLPVLIGNANKLRNATGWAPKYTVERTFQDLVDAQKD